MNQKEKTIAVMLFLAIIAASASAIPEGFLAGDLSLALDKQQYEPGETVNATMLLFNSEQTPLAEGILVMEIVKGNEHYSPTQMSDADNVFFEQEITGINMRAQEQKEIKFSYSLPNNIADGNYRIDAYFKNKISSIVGLPDIFGAPRNAQFTVNNKKRCGQNTRCISGEWPNLQISRTKTEFNNAIGPVGAATEPGSIVKGTVFIENNSSEKATNKTLLIKMCEWDDTACQNTDLTKPIEKTITIDSIEANSEKEISVELTAPTRPSAYAIRLELTDGNKTESLYRSRIVVTGATAKIRKLTASNYEFSANEKAVINIMLGPSPDHYNNLAFTDFELKATVKDLQDNSTIFSGTEKIAEVKETYPEKEFSFTTKKPTSSFLVCAWTEKNSVVFDKECLEFDSAKFSKPGLETEINTAWNYDYANNVLELTFCSNPKEKPLNGEYFLLESNTTNQDPIAYDTLEGNNCVEKKISVKPANFELHLLDYDTKRPSTIQITLKPLETAIVQKNCSELNGKECKQNTQCTIATVKTRDTENCCEAECIEKTKTGDKTPSQLPILQAIAIIGIIALLALGYKVKKG